MLLDAVAGLGLQRRTVVVMRYGLGYTPTEIAEMRRQLLDTPPLAAWAPASISLR